MAMACMHPCFRTTAQSAVASEKKPRRNNLPLVTRAHFSTQLHSVKLNTFGQSAKLNNTIQGEKLKMVALLLGFRFTISQLNCI
jgi:hypothetical protein